jgi:hypothetical protein
MPEEPAPDVSYAQEKPASGENGERANAASQEAQQRFRRLTGETRPYYVHGDARVVVRTQRDHGGRDVGARKTRPHVEAAPLATWQSPMRIDRTPCRWYTLYRRMA